MGKIIYEPIVQYAYRGTVFAFWVSLLVNSMYFYCQSMVLKIFICPSHIANWIPGALESMGRDRHPIRTLWVFPLPIIDIWHMQIWISLKMINSKDHISSKILHRSQWEMPTRRQERYLNVIHSMRYEINALQQLSASTCFKTIVGLCIKRE